MKRLLKLVAIATVAAAWNPFGRRKAQDATTTTTTTPGTCDASDEACAAAAEADALASGRAPECYCGNLAVRFRGLGAWVCAEEGVDRGAYCIYGREPERLKVNR